jgi:putative peptidoglycan lipid II flippase
MTDAFNVAFRLPNMFRRLFGEGAFSQAFVPVLGATKEQQGDEATQLPDRPRGNRADLGACADLRRRRRGGAALVWMHGQRPAAGPAQGFEAAVVMARWMFPYIGFMSMVALGAGMLNTWKRFAVPAARRCC